MGQVQFKITHLEETTEYAC